MKTLEELQDENPIIEADDWRAGTLMVQDIIHCVPELKIEYLARWAARLREHYVAIGREVEAAEAPPRSCQKCTDAAGCHSQGHCVFTGYPLRRTA
jgi:hypothetical protein